MTRLISLSLILLAASCGETRPDAKPLGDGNDSWSINNDEPGSNTADNSDPGAQWEPGAYDRSVTHDGLDRTFRLYIPQTYGAEPMPLLLVFHGGGGDGDRMVAVGFDDVADREGFVVVYPDGMHSNWADGRGTTDAAVAGIDDIGFVRTLVSELQSELHIDADRIFATGASNGGMMSYRIGCDLSDVFAAVAPVIAALPSELECQPERPVSVISFHGTDDPFIPIDGGDTAHKEFPRLGDGGLVESAEATMEFWHAQNECDTPSVLQLPPEVESDPTRVELTTADCADNTRVHSYVIDGMGHTWPGRGGQLPAVSGTPTEQLDATSVIWAFLADAGR